MKPEERFNQQVWEILQDIKEEILATEKGKPVKYRIPNVVGVGIIPRDRRIKILYKLQEKEAFKIQRNSEGVRIGTGDIFYLIINPSKFDEIYQKYKSTCDLNSYLNTYQDEILKVARGEVKPGDVDILKFAHVETTQPKKAPIQTPTEKILEKQKSQLALRPTGITEKIVNEMTDSKQEQYYEEEIKLLGKLLQICNPATKSVELVRPAHIANSDSYRAGFDNIETLKDLEGIYEVLSNFDPLLEILAKSRTGIVKANINYQKLLERAENLHDEVESWKGTVYGIEQQKRQVLERLQERFRKNPQDEYTYSEWLLGSYAPRVESSPLRTSLSNPDPNRTDIRYQFMRAMRELEKDGHFEIVDVKIDFSAEPEPTEISLNAHKWSLGERSLEFIPAKHCKVTIRPAQQKQKEDLYRKKPKCEIKGGVGFVKLGSKESKPFKKLNGRQWKLAKQLVDFFGSAKTDETIYENIKIPSDPTRYPEILSDPYRSASRICSIIENTIAEIQRNFAQSDLAGLFSIHHDGKKVWMDFLQ